MTPYTFLDEFLPSRRRFTTPIPAVHIPSPRLRLIASYWLCKGEVADWGKPESHDDIPGMLAFVEWCVVSVSWWLGLLCKAGKRFLKSNKRKTGNCSRLRIDRQGLVQSLSLKPFIIKIFITWAIVSQPDYVGDVWDQFKKPYFGHSGCISYAPLATW